MQKFVYCFCFIVILIISGCGGGKDNSSSVDETENPTSTVNDYLYTKPIPTQLSNLMEYQFQSDIDWNNSDETTATIIWSGSGSQFLDDLSALNPTFQASQSGTYQLTQTLISNNDREASSTIEIVVETINDSEAARLLQQATFGPSLDSIEEVKSLGYSTWIDEQIALPVSRHLPILVHKRNEKWRWQAWSIQSTYAEDQLRQRMGFAFSEIMTVSFKAIAILYNHQAGMTDYYDTLLDHSLGNYRELLEAVTRHPVMGIYLTYKGNNPGERPDENYAREIMQLFSIGLVELNMDGTEKLDEQGNTIPTYSQATVENFAKIFTGLCFPQPMNNRYCNRFSEGGTFELPMVFWEDFHDKGEKHLLNDLIVPAGQSADKDLADALDNLASHSNTAPFISKLLIKRLVTSNPSPDYVRRVAEIFVSTGGDLAAVAKAILLDKEARFGQTANTFGKLREPLLRMTHLFRALDATMPNVDQYRFGDGTAFYDLFGQAPFYSPSVFNFFMPNHTQGELKEADLTGPEFQILNASQLAVTENKFLEFVFAPAVHYPNINKDYLTDVYQQQGVEGVIEKLDILFTSGLMSESMKQTIRNQVNQMVIDQNEPVGAVIDNVLVFVLQSPEFAIQR